jgi:hypothetical protein
MLMSHLISRLHLKSILSYLSQGIVLSGLLWGLGLLQCSISHADPLSLSELNRFNQWVQCVERCESDYAYFNEANPTYEEQRLRFRCLANGCGEYGPPSRLWEKDGARQGGVYSIDRHDLQLAIIEYQSADNLKDDPQNRRRQDFDDPDGDRDFSQLICYGEDETGQASPVVIPGTLCAYDSDASIGEQAYGCPYLGFLNMSGNETALLSSHQSFCNEMVCDLPEYHFSSDLSVFDSSGDPDSDVYWIGSHRPFLCPEVVCDLYQQGGELYLDAEVSWTDEALINKCSPSEEPGQESVPQWLSDTLGDQKLCDLALEGGSGCSLFERCTYQDDLGRGVCVPRRECVGQEQCTVAHLEKKSETDQEVIVWVYFDHSDAPVRVLDFHLNYPNNQMVLADARRLPALEYSGGPGGKQLTTTHLSDQTLRLSIFDTASSSPIPYGPLVELVFQRSGLYGTCHDVNQNNYRDLIYDANRPCHQEFLACDGILEQNQTPRFNQHHATLFERQEHLACFQALEICLGVDPEYQTSILRLINF